MPIPVSVGWQLEPFEAQHVATVPDAVDHRRGHDLVSALRERLRPTRTEEPTSSTMRTPTRRSLSSSAGSRPALWAAMSRATQSLRRRMQFDSRRECPCRQSDLKVSRAQS